jgi:hypothetical protein
MDALRRRALVTDGREPRWHAPTPRPQAPKEPDRVALEIWELSEPIEGTIAENYLQRRGIPLLPCRVRHYRGAMIAGIEQPYLGITAIQRTPISSDGERRSGDRWTKGDLGNGAVRLGAAQAIMGLAEGTETALSAMVLSGMSVWASLGAGRLHKVELPELVREVHIFADNDEPGREAAARTREVHLRLGRRVVVQTPPIGIKDFNDFLILDADQPAAAFA